jgi:KilA-N domain
MDNSIKQFVFKEHNGNNVRIDPVDRRVCLTDICNASGKNVADFLRLQNTTDYIDALSRTMGIPIMVLLEVARGNTGSWGHPQLAIKCAGWCSPKLEVLMTSWVYEILTTGKVELETSHESLALPSRDDTDRVVNMATSAASRSVDRLDSEPKDKINLSGWFTVTELLEMLGESISTDNSLAKDLEFRFWLNRQVADLYRANNGEEPPQISRKKTKAYCYPPSYKSFVSTYIDQWNDARFQLLSAA